MLPDDARELSRHLSRIVYVVLYLVIGLRLIVGLVNWTWQGGTFDFNLFDERFRDGPDREGFSPKDDFQMFLACGLAAIVILRVFAYTIWLRSVERAALPKVGRGGVISCESTSASQTGASRKRPRGP